MSTAESNYEVAATPAGDKALATEVSVGAHWEPGSAIHRFETQFTAPLRDSLLRCAIPHSAAVWGAGCPLSSGWVFAGLRCRELIGTYKPGHTHWWCPCHLAGPRAAIGRQEDGRARHPDPPPARAHRPLASQGEPDVKHVIINK
eukprot:5490602-Pyramimonas_sp.AAC.1